MTKRKPKEEWKKSGRPTKYEGEETIKKVEDYLENCKNEWERVVSGSYETKMGVGRNI